jgi:autotransporter family porin
MQARCASATAPLTPPGDGASGLYANGTSQVGSVTLDNVTLHSERSAAVEASAASLILNVHESRLSGGNGQLLYVSHYTDPQNPANKVYSDVTMNVTRSALAGDIVVADPANAVAVNLQSASELTGTVSHASSLSIDDSSAWHMNNDSRVGRLVNNGTVDFADLNNFNTLTVTGDYAGDGGLLKMNSVLGDDGSQTNRLIVNGNVQQGTTRVAINNLGGHGAQTVEGIRIVEVDGQSLGSFVKTGRIVAGAWDYDLVKKGESWYLTSQQPQANPQPTPQPTPQPAPGPTPAPTPGVKPQPQPQPTASGGLRPESGSYTANMAAGNTLFTFSLHDRLGEAQYVNALTGQKEITSLWLRQAGGHTVWQDGSGELETRSNRYVAQIGGDIARWSVNGADRGHVGVMAGYANHHSATRNDRNGYRSKGSVNGYSIGGYATWYAEEANPYGAWLDGWLQYSWFNNDVNGDGLATESYKSHGFTASLEGGYTWKTGEFTGRFGTLNEWFIQPQAQLVWMGVRADSHREQNGTRVTGSGDGNLQTRLGLRTFIKSHHAIDDRKERLFQPFAELNWLHNTRAFSTRLDDVRVGQDGTRHQAEVKLGVEGQINPRLNLWGNISVRLGDAGYSDSTAMFGAKYHF